MYRDGIFSDFILKGIMFQPDVKHCPFVSDRLLEFMSGACLFFLDECLAAFVYLCKGCGSDGYFANSCVSVS